jgi:hypothetical protein
LKHPHLSVPLPSRERKMGEKDFGFLSHEEENGGVILYFLLKLKLGVLYIFACL